MCPGQWASNAERRQFRDPTTGYQHLDGPDSDASSTALAVTSSSCTRSLYFKNERVTTGTDSMQAVITGMCILLLVLRLAPGLDALLRCNLSQVCLNLY